VRACAPARTGTVTRKKKPNFVQKNVGKSDQLESVKNTTKFSTSEKINGRKEGRKVLDHDDHEQSIVA